MSVHLLSWTRCALSFLLLWSVARNVAAVDSINLNPSIRYQIMTGWEGLVSGGVGDIEPVKPYLGSAFDIAVNDLGITRCRLEIQSGAETPIDWARQFVSGTMGEDEYMRQHAYKIFNDNNDPNSINPAGFHFTLLDYTIDSQVIPLRQRTLARGEQFYIKLQYVDFGSSTFEHADNPAEYAEFMLALFQHMRSKYGFVPDGIDIVLEPELTQEPGWPAVWDYMAIGNAIVATANKLQANGFPIPEFSAPETTSAGNTVKIYNWIKMFVPQAIPYIKEISYHRYDVPSTAIIQGIGDLAAAEGKRSAMTEWWDPRLSYQTLHEDIRIGRNSSWQQGVFADNYNGPGSWTNIFNGVASVSSYSRFTRQYTKYVRPGAQRVEATSSNAAFDPLAFINGNGKNVVVVKAAAGGSFSIANLPAGTYGIFYTTAAQYDVNLADVTIVGGQNVTGSIPAAGVLTVYGKSAGAAQAPAITTQPANVTVTVGQTATFSVGASGTGPLAYQWQKNGANIAGATGSSYTTAPAVSADNGTSFRAIVSNAAGSVTSAGATLTVTAVGNTPPSVVLTSPTNGQSFTTPANISLSANASDGDGTISKVDFYQGGALIGADTSSPYSIAWNNVAAGSYSLTARATDNVGALTMSGAVSITVNAVSTGGTQTPYGGSPMAIPGTVAAAKYDNGGEGIAYHDADASNLMSSIYRPGQGVDSNGSGVGWILAGEWLEYSINVSASGSYTIAIPLSHPGTGGAMHVSFNGVNATGSLDFPTTASWETQQTITKTVNLSAGPQVMLVAFDSNGSTGYGPGLGDIVISPTGGGAVVGSGTGLTGQYFDNLDFTGAHFTRTDAAVNFDWGMGAPTSSMGVDYFSIRWTGQVQAQYAQAYTFHVTGDDGVRLWVNGNLLIDKWLVQAPTEYAAMMAMTAGTKYDIKLEYYENYGGTAAQLRWSSASTAKQIIPSSQLYPTGAPARGQNPYSGTPMAIPGIISAPRYDTGGEGVAYHDMEASNLMSGIWRPGEGVDTDNNRGIGWIQAGEWIEYTVNVAQAGTYVLSTPACHPGPGGTFHVNFNGVDMTGTMTAPNTGAWEVNQTISRSVSLSAGAQVMQVVFDTNGSTGYVCGIGDITLVSIPTGTG